MINIYPADYERLKHNWIHVHSKSINAKFLRLDNLPTIIVGSNWSSDQSNKLLDLLSSIETVKELGSKYLEGGKVNLGFVKATPPAWRGGGVLNFSVNTLVTTYQHLNRFPKLDINGKKSDATKLSGSLEDVKTLLRMVSPSKVEDNRYYSYKDFEIYAKYTPIEFKKGLQQVSGAKEAGRKLEFSDYGISNNIEVIKNIEIGNGSNVSEILEGEDDRLLSLVFAQNETEVYRFGHHFVPTKISVDPSPIMITYFDDNGNKKLTLPYVKATMEFSALCVLDGNKLTKAILPGGS